jgi:hypothetical protein
MYYTEFMCVLYFMYVAIHTGNSHTVRKMKISLPQIGRILKIQNDIMYELMLQAYAKRRVNFRSNLYADRHIKLYSEMHKVHLHPSF